MSVFNLGFRPFYALASIFAIAAMIIWLCAFAGFSGTGTYLQGIVWHSHEMLYGFSVAVIAGFLLTAVQNWTGLPTPTGTRLAALAGLWLTARVLMLTGSSLIAAVADVLFLPALLVTIAGPVLRSKNKRNYKILLIIAALAFTHGLFHLASHGVVQAGLARTSLFVGIDLLIILMAVVGGRIIPAFTLNAIPEAKSRHEPRVEIVTFVAMGIVLVVTALSGSWSPAPLLLVALLVVTAAAHATRLALWDPLRTTQNPLLWMLPAAYSWIPFAFLLRALSVGNIVPATAWIHALTMGAVSGLMLAMMMRSSLGHTGRPLLATRLDMAAFLLLQLAAVVRVSAGIVAGDGYRFWITASGVIWILAFLIFAIRYVPMLTQPRK